MLRRQVADEVKATKTTRVHRSADHDNVKPVLDAHASETAASGEGPRNQRILLWCVTSSDILGHLGIACFSESCGYNCLKNE